MLSFKVGGESTPQHVKVPALKPGKEFRHQRRVKLTVAQNYQVTAKADSANTVKESNEGNNTMIKRFKVTRAQTAKLPDVGMKGFLKIGKRQREVKWNQTIVLTPADATLISNGKMVSSQTGISLTALQVKSIHIMSILRFFHTTIEEGHRYAGA